MVLLPVFHLGCAIHYRDAKTGTEHVWGLTHVKMRVASEEGAPEERASSAVVTRVESLGLGLHAGDGDGGLSLGWDRRTRVVVRDDSALSIEWPTTDLFDVRIHQNPPASPPDTSASP